MSAVPKEIIEFELAEEYHWLPSQIEKIPYKKLQKLFVIKNQKNASAQNKAQINKFRQEHQQQTSGRGQTRRFTREV